MKYRSSPQNNISFFDERSWSSGRSLLFLAIIAIALIAPFANKAFHIDDPLFVWAAKHIQSHPADPYGFNVNWYSEKTAMWHITKNPPLASYYMALAAFFVGWTEKAIHLAFLIPAIAVFWGTYLFAKKFCSRPILATLFGLATPAFIVSSTTVMCDVMMLAFWMWATVLWVRGIDKDEHAALLLSAFLVAFSILSKYYGMTLMILLPVYALAKKRKIGIWAVYMLIPMCAFFLYQWKMRMLYGGKLVSDIFTYGAYVQGDINFGIMAKCLTGLIFTGGCLATVFFYKPFLWPKKILIMELIVFCAFVAGISFLPAAGRLSLHSESSIRWPQIFQMSLLAIAGINVLALMISEFWRRKGDAVSMFLFCWCAITFIFATFVNWSVNARSILPMAPAIGVLLARRLDRLVSIKRSYSLYIPLILAMALSLYVTFCDYRLANSARSAANEVYIKYNGMSKHLLFQGHWGFQYYMELEGGMPADIEMLQHIKRAILIIPKNNTNLFSLPAGLRVVSLEKMEYRMPTYLATMSKNLGAGFYADAWGPLPFSFGVVQPETYEILYID